MLMPSIFGENLLDDFFGFPKDGFEMNFSGSGMMQTDVKETDNSYEITMNLPGFQKEDVKGELKDGYLIVSASTSQTNDEKDKDGHYIRKERFSGSCSRSFYVGDTITQEDIKAKFENGTLKLSVPKAAATPITDEHKYISIAG